MKVTEKKIDELNREFTVEVSSADYADKKKKKLSELRRNAEIKGFRKGMVPPALIAKMYGERVLVDTVNDAIAEGINNYIRENKLRVVGEPLPKDDQPKNEWVDGNDFTFVFEAGLNPEVSLELSEADEVPYYTITVAADAKAEMKKNLLAQYGSLTEAETAGENDFIIADFAQGETKVEGTYVAIRSIAEAVRPAFIGIKAGDTLNVNVNEAFENETDRAAMLKVNKDELAGMPPEWTMSVVKVQTYADAELCQETYDKIFGEGNLKSEEEFDAKIEDRLRSEYKGEADYRLQTDMKNYLVEKAGIKLPETFLKKWLFYVNDGKFTKEEIEKEFPMFEEDYKWQLVRDFIMDKYNVKVEEADIMASAKGFAAYQFAMYGMSNVPDEQLETFAKQILSQEKDSRRIIEQVETEKAIDAVKPLVSLKKKKISVAKFRELK